MPRPKQPNHNLSRTPEYRSWSGIIQRCTNPAKEHYENYGGRGITLHPAWRHDFLAFLAHVGPRPTPKHSIDRINNDLGYVPGNLKWSTITEQRKNTTNNLWISYHGQRRLLCEV